MPKFVKLTRNAEHPAPVWLAVDAIIELQEATKLGEPIGTFIRTVIGEICVTESPTQVQSKITSRIGDQ